MCKASEDYRAKFLKKSYGVKSLSLFFLWDFEACFCTNSFFRSKKSLNPIFVVIKLASFWAQEILDLSLVYKLFVSKRPA